MRSLPYVLLAACGVLIAACGARDDMTPLVPVQPGAAARAMALLGHGGPNDPHPAGRTADAGENDTSDAEPGRIAFSCLEARGAMKVLARVPCKVTITPMEGDGDEPTELVFETGRASVDAPAGKYRVIASRGPEYAVSTWDVEVVSGETAWGPNEGAIVLRRVVDTRGYIGADLDPASQGAVVEDAAAGIEIMLGEARPIVQRAKLEDVIEPLDVAGLDAAEAWNDRDGFLARIGSKHPVTAVASAPARTYVRVDDDGSLTTWSPAREADLARGIRERRDVVLTTGPFLRVTANGAPIGGVARATSDGDVEVKVHVECAPWVTVDRVSIERVSGARVEPRPFDLRPSPSDARVADVTLLVHATSDDAFVVLVDSSSAPPAAGGVSPATRAMTGAIWIDADGDGESLGRTAFVPDARALERPKPPTAAKGTKR